MEIIDPVNLRPGEHAPVPNSKHALIVEALRFANRISLLLGDIDRAVLSRVKDDNDHRFDDLHDMTIRRFSDCSGLHLFIAAHNMGLDLPADLRED